MNNTPTTKRNLTVITAILIATALVVGTFSTTTSVQEQQSAFAYQQQKKKGGSQENSKNGNTVTPLEINSKSSVNGFDGTNVNELQNQVCTHPNTNGVCSEEGVATITAGNNTGPSPQTPKTCVGCLMTFLTVKQQTDLLSAFRTTNLENVCNIIPVDTTVSEFARVLQDLGVDNLVIVKLIECMINAGVQFT